VTTDGETTFALGLGGNLGDVRRTLAAALRRLEAALGPLAVAPLYRSQAVSAIPQPDYLNTAAVGRTALPPDAVLALAKRLEREAGRRPGPRDAPRPLDVDLLLYGSRVADDPALTLPHPRLAVRRFALAPLADVAPELAVPPGGTTVAALLAALPPGPGGGAVERVAGAEWREAPAPARPDAPTESAAPARRDPSTDPGAPRPR
jgi:2-amino-4-hydroxy-6-hydroxymethyldihydropteridine diphosphokinase